MASPKKKNRATPADAVVTPTELNSAGASASTARASKARRKDQRKEAQLVIRLETALRDTFVHACQADDSSASRELRRFMRRYLKERLV